MSVYRCENCERDTEHEGRICVECDGECCMPEDGEMCAHCYAERALLIEAEAERRMEEAALRGLGLL